MASMKYFWKFLNEGVRYNDIEVSYQIESIFKHSHLRHFGDRWFVTMDWFLYDLHFSSKGPEIFSVRFSFSFQTFDLVTGYRYTNFWDAGLANLHLSLINHPWSPMIILLTSLKLIFTRINIEFSYKSLTNIPKYFIFMWSRYLFAYSV